MTRLPVVVSATARFSSIARSAIGRRDADADLDRGVVAGARLDGALEVEEDPDVGGLLEVELLDLDLAGPRGRRPVDPVEGVAGRVRADRRRQRRRLQRPHGRRAAALEADRLQPPARDRLEARVDDERQAVAHGRARLEEAERVAGPDLERVDPEVAAPAERDLGDPRPLAVRPERDRPAGEGHRQGRRVVDLEPQLREPARAPQRVGDPQLLADVAWSWLTA